MDTQSPATTASRLAETHPGLPVFIPCTINGIHLNLAWHNQQLWMRLNDLCGSLLGYSLQENKYAYSRTLKGIFANRKHDLRRYQIGFCLEGGGNTATSFINMEGVVLAAQWVKGSRTEGLRRWLDEGGLQAALTEAKKLDNSPTEAPAPNFEAHAPSPKPNNVIPLVYPELEQHKHYGRELFRVLLRYTSETEIRDVVALIEEIIAERLASRYSPGLNAAVYDVFARYTLKGGVK